MECPENTAVAAMYYIPAWRKNIKKERRFHD